MIGQQEEWGQAMKWVEQQTDGPEEDEDGQQSSGLQLVRCLCTDDMALHDGIQSCFAKVNETFHL